jgi:hypothetical protein
LKGVRLINAFSNADDHVQLRTDVGEFNLQ